MVQLLWSGISGKIYGIHNLYVNMIFTCYFVSDHINYEHFHLYMIR